MEKKYGGTLINQVMTIWTPKKLDWYIIKKFLGTFFFAILLIISIACIFDFSEKVDEFMESKPSFKMIVFDYYLNFIPYFVVLFSSLFIFISVIFFTSKMAYDTEIIAILSSGISFRRLMLPYFLSAGFLAIFSFLLNDYIIPEANRKKLDFENTYVHLKPKNFDKDNVNMQVAPGIFIQIGRFMASNNVGYNFSMEHIEDNKLVSKLVSERIEWNNSLSKWRAINYRIRNINGIYESIEKGEAIDTIFNLHPGEFKRTDKDMETMNLAELNDFIGIMRMRGADNVKRYQVEKNKRIAFPFSTFILTLIGVSLSTRKVRGGIGVQIAVGITFSFAYILFMQFSVQFAINGSLSPFMAAWIPNFIFLIIGLILYRLAPK